MFYMCPKNLKFYKRIPYKQIIFNKPKDRVILDMLPNFNDNVKIAKNIC